MNSKTVRVDVVEKKLDAIFADINQCQLPGVAVGIAIDGTPVYRKGFGLANLELPTALTPSMRMRIGSITKHFTSLAFLLLCEGGHAAVEDSIGKYVPELHPIGRNVTVRQLMGHVSGLRDSFDICWSFNGVDRHVTSKELLGYYQNIDDANFPPDATWMYNNGGYLLLSAAVERISGEPLEHFLHTRIFEPVGMYDTVLRRWDNEYVPNSASLHYREDSGTYTRASLGTELDGVGGIASTVDDMLRWLRCMSAPVVGSEATWEGLRTPLRLANGISTGYGLGLFAGSYRGVETVGHVGGVLGGNSQMMKVPSAGLDIAILGNRSDVVTVDLALRVLDTCLIGLAPAAVGASLVASGTFFSEETGQVVQLLGKEGRQFAVLNGLEMPMEASEDGTTLRPSGHTILSFKMSITLVGDQERPSAIRLIRFGTSEKLVAVLAPEPDRIASEIAGRYRVERIDTEAVVSLTKIGARLETSGRFGRVEYALEALGDSLWRAKGPYELGGVVAFDRRATRFEFSTTRTSRLQFTRVER